MITRLLALPLILVAAATTAAAQATEAIPYKPAGAAPARSVMSTPTTDVPMLLLGRAPRVFPVVEAYVNGRGPYRFAIETGAEFATVTPKLAAELRLARTGGGGPNDMPEYRIDSLRVGGATFETFTVSALHTRATDIDGLLGLPIYGELLLTLDYPGKRIRFERGALPEPNGHTILPLTKGERGHFWRVPIGVGDDRTLAVIDTRSSGTVGFTPAFLDGHHVRFDGELRTVGMAAGAAIAPVPVKAGFLADDVTIGIYTFPNAPADVRPLPPGFTQDPIVGTQVLQNFIVTLDQQHQRVRLEHDGAPRILLPRPTLPRASATSSDGGTTAAAGGPRRVRIDPNDYVGTWGDRTITFENEQFYLQRPNGAKYMLVPTGLDRFTLEEFPAAQYEFVRDATGKPAALRARNQDGQWETVKRAPNTP